MASRAGLSFSNVRVPVPVPDLWQIRIVEIVYGHGHVYVWETVSGHC